jgi:pentatricopeptide repeat protein
MVSACARLGDLDCALTVIDKMKERGWQPDSDTLNHLLWSPWEISGRGLTGNHANTGEHEEEEIDQCEWGVVRGNCQLRFLEALRMC